MADTHDSDYCVVCLEANPTYHFSPCQHKCVCEDCAKQYIAMEEVAYTRCPVCRREFDIITSEISREMMQQETKAEDEEEDQLQFACALSQSEFDCMKSLLEPTNLSEDEMIAIACALSEDETSASPQQQPLEDSSPEIFPVNKDKPVEEESPPSVQPEEQDAADDAKPKTQTHSNKLEIRIPYFTKAFWTRAR